MSNSISKPEQDGLIASIENRDNPFQVVNILYRKEENAFVTSGIRTHFGIKEILIPVHLVALDPELIGSIISAILEKVSLARETNSFFSYASEFEIFGKQYSLTECGEYMKMESDPIPLS